MTPLLRRMIEDMRLRNLAPRTIPTYVERVAAFARHLGTSPAHPPPPVPLGPHALPASFPPLARDRPVSFSYLSQARSALRFLYRITLGREWGDDRVGCAKVPRKLPVVLSTDEVAQFFVALANLK